MAKLTEEERKALGGSTYDQQYFTDDELQAAAKVRAEAQKTGDWTSAHNYVEKIRSNYGYSGDVNGSNNGGGYTALNDAAKEVTTTSEAPTYVSQYADAINTLQNSILNREAFSYDYNTDPSYQAYKKQYTREGQRATADALGQAAALTGGMASTAAVNAATQAGDYYSAQLSDKIPELYQAAYSMYQDKGNELYNQLNTLLTLENADYAKYQDQLAQYNTDRNYNYQTDQDAQSLALSRLQALLETGNTTGITDSDLALTGYSRDQIEAIAKYYADKNSDDSGTVVQDDEEETVDYYTLYEQVKAATGQTNIFTPEQFNRQTFMQEKYGTYENYCKNILSQHGISYDQLANKINIMAQQQQAQQEEQDAAITAENEKQEKIVELIEGWIDAGVDEEEIYNRLKRRGYTDEEIYNSKLL